jgi:hypothetical protein
MSILGVYRDKGIDFGDLTAGEITVTVTPEAVEYVRSKLNEPDRRKGTGKGKWG